MKQEAAYHPGATWLVRTAVLVILLAGSSSRHLVLADPARPQALGLKMTMSAGTGVILGEPLVVHYTIKNVVPTGQITFHVGENNNEWYTFSLTDSKGRTVKAVPPPTLGTTQGLHQSPEASIPHGDRVEGDLVVTRCLVVPSPGVYTLTVHATTPYYVEPDGAWYPEGRPSDIQQVALTQDFSFPVTVTPADPVALRATAEALRRRLMDVRYSGQWVSATEQLFSMPESIALPTWQSLVNDPASNEFVLADAAQQLSFRPSRAKADLVAQILWDSGRDPSTRSSAQAARIWAAMLKMYGTSDSSLKQYVHSLYNMHGISDARILEAQTASHPN